MCCLEMASLENAGDSGEAFIVGVRYASAAGPYVFYAEQRIQVFVGYCSLNIFFIGSTWLVDESLVITDSISRALHDASSQRHNTCISMRRIKQDCIDIFYDDLFGVLSNSYWRDACFYKLSCDWFCTIKDTSCKRCPAHTDEGQ